MLFARLPILFVICAISRCISRVLDCEPLLKEIKASPPIPKISEIPNIPTIPQIPTMSKIPNVPVNIQNGKLLTKAGTRPFRRSSIIERTSDNDEDLFLI
ncbi:hypothetical protein CROQUDRAFT_268026 [Cronartium quercuum f. sp. fusiforme G11]|uniref:Secreted protein n=1 Tax=Cronartium quercuum f. sp. fusiforme G11 TaxID=708437 RepID=A0A9P6T7Q2_9BASI|nr:hypothetical protein CROQUDRAFT_268026 [Cronartium quercuum f. sp. fusiforme G11]